MKTEPITSKSFTLSSVPPRRKSSRAKKDMVTVAVHMPRSLLAVLDAIALAQDSDRSKIIRDALREYLKSHAA